MSRVVRVSDDVYEGLKKLAKPFEDTPDSVIRRLLHPASSTQTPASSTSPSRHRSSNVSDRRMRAEVQGKTLLVQFEGDDEESWDLAAKGDKTSLRAVRDKAWAYARERGASEGQLRAIQKALSDAGYYLGTPRKT